MLEKPECSQKVWRNEKTSEVSKFVYTDITQIVNFYMKDFFSKYDQIHYYAKETLEGYIRI